MTDKPDSITFKCRKCLQDIEFSLASVPEDSIFPVELKNIHGTPAHTLVIKINDQWRIAFRWQGNNAHDVRLIDYH